MLWSRVRLRDVKIVNHIMSMNVYAGMNVVGVDRVTLGCFPVAWLLLIITLLLRTESDSDFNSTACTVSDSRSMPFHIYCSF